MEKQIQRKEEINKFVEKLLDKIVIRAKEMTNGIKLDTFQAVVEVNKKCVRGLKQFIAWQHQILLTQKMILI